MPVSDGSVKKKIMNVNIVMFFCAQAKKNIRAIINTLLYEKCDNYYSTIALLTSLSHLKYIFTTKLHKFNARKNIIYIPTQKNIQDNFNTKMSNFATLKYTPFELVVFLISESQYFTNLRLASE